MRARDPRHCRHGAVRLDARPLHQKRAGLRCRLQPHQPPDLPGYQDDAGPDCPRQRVRAGADPARRQQGGLGVAEGGPDGGGNGPRSDMGLSLCRGIRSTSDKCE